MRFLTIALTLLLSFSASADKKEDFKICKSIAELAEIIADARYSGAAYDKMYEAAIASKFSESDLELISMAYNLPNYQTDKNKQRAISEFKNKVFGSCIKVKGEK